MPDNTIPLLGLDDVSLPISELFRQIEDGYGFVPNIVRTISHSEDMLQVFVPLWAEVYQAKVIGKRNRAILALATAYAQSCEYCVGPMSQSAIIAGLSPDEIESIATHNYQSFPDQEKILIDYAMTLSLQPDSMPQQIIDRLASYYSYKELVDIVITIAMYNFTSRVLKGLNVPSDIDYSVKTKPHFSQQPHSEN